jgi:hypothetical protein
VLEDERIGIAVGPGPWWLIEMDLVLEVDPEKDGGIVIEIGSVQKLIIENVLAGETLRGHLTEMKEREKPPDGGMIAHRVAIALGTKLQARHVSPPPRL